VTFGGASKRRTRASSRDHTLAQHRSERAGIFDRPSMKSTAGNSIIDAASQKQVP
jgi:hypothetical protein